MVRALSLARERLFQVHKKAKFPLTVSLATQVHISGAEGLVDVDTQVYAVNATSTEAVVSGPSGTKVWCLDTNQELHSFPQIYSALLYLSGPDSMAFGVCGAAIQSLTAQIRFEASEIQSLAAHPLEPFFVAVSTRSFDICDPSGPIAGVRVDSDIHASDIHVDGTLCAISQGNAIAIYDITSRQKVSEIAVEPGHTVTKVRFALNGYWLVAATACLEASAVVVFDLRKNSIVHSFALAAGPTDFVLDPSCQVLVTANGGSMQAHLYTKKAKSWRENVQSVAGVLASMSMASSVHLFQADSELKVCGVQQGRLVQYKITFTLDSALNLKSTNSLQLGPSKA